jgi:hypothetical protein
LVVAKHNEQEFVVEGWVIVKWPEIIDMSCCPLAIDEVFNDIDGLSRVLCAG